MNLLFHSICVAVAIICATATAASTPRLWRDGGRRHLRPPQQRRRGTRVGAYKHTKKQNVVPQQCTPEQFVGDYKYTNCQGVETQVRIACATDKATKHPCDYQEAPLKNDTDDGCVVQGSFGATHIRMDPAKPGVCQLNFVALKDSCKANALPSGFGMRAEVDMTAGHADTSSTSTLVLWFSNDGGDVYYNEDEPQEPVFLHQDIPRGRKLGGCSTCNPEYPDGCEENECAKDEFIDGCHDCMCYNKDNKLWCDGTNYAQIDNDWIWKKDNPAYKNRKCNTKFPAVEGNSCSNQDWKCGCKLATKSDDETCTACGETTLSLKCGDSDTCKETWVKC